MFEGAPVVCNPDGPGEHLHVDVTECLQRPDVSDQMLGDFVSGVIVLWFGVDHWANPAAHSGSAWALKFPPDHSSFDLIIIRHPPKGRAS